MFNTKKLLENIETIIESLLIREPETRSKLRELTRLAYNRKWEKILAFPHPRPAIPAFLAGFLSSIQKATPVHEIKQIEKECIDFKRTRTSHPRLYSKQH